MISDLDKTIKELLIRELPTELTSQISFSFAPPDAHFPPTSVELPAIDIFLYDIREDLELRASERMYSNQSSVKHVTMQHSSVPVSCSYIITAWSANTTMPDEDEHRLLGAIMQALLRYEVLPADILQGTLANIKPLPKVKVIQQTHLQSLGEFWSALGGRPKALIHYNVTVPLYAHAPIENVPLVTTLAAKIHNRSGQLQETIASEVAIVGKVTASDTQQLLPGAVVSMSNAQMQAVTLNAVNGYFHAVNLAEGDYTLSASLPNSTEYGTSMPIIVSIAKDELQHIIQQQVTLVLPHVD